MGDPSKLKSRTTDGTLRVVVETPRGARAKLRYDPDLGAFAYLRPLVLGLAYPYDWGFAPSTLASDGDPLDAMVVHDAITYPGIVIECNAVGVVLVTQKKKLNGGKRERNDRLIVVPAYAPRIDDVRSLPKRVRDELEQFFLTVVLFEDKRVKIEGWGGPKEAKRLLAEAERVYAKSKRA
jgi:inorganic pyrophosphatase